MNTQFSLDTVWNFWVAYRYHTQQQIKLSYKFWPEDCWSQSQALMLCLPLFFFFFLKVLVLETGLFHFWMTVVKRDVLQMSQKWWYIKSLVLFICKWGHILNCTLIVWGRKKRVRHASCIGRLLYAGYFVPSLCLHTECPLRCFCQDASILPSFRMKRTRWISAI